MNTVEACEGMIDGSIKSFVGLGGNFVRAIPEREKVEAAWQTMRLTVQIATKLNRSHLINGKVAYLLPCLGRSEQDVQQDGPQTVTMEDSLSMIHGSVGKRKPASEHLLSELAIVAGIAKATLPPKPNVRWDEWVSDYGKVRDLMSPKEIAAAGLREGQIVSLVSDAEDGTHRQVDDLTLTPFDLPDECIGAYYPETNPLIPLWYNEMLSKTPAAKGVPVRIVPAPDGGGSRPQGGV